MAQNSINSQGLGSVSAAVADTTVIFDDGDSGNPKLATIQSIIDLATGGGGDLSRVSTISITNNANLDFDLTGGGTVFLLVWNNLLMQTSGSSMLMRFSDDGGATFEADAGDYKYQIEAVNTLGSSESTSSDSATSILMTSASNPINTGVIDRIDGYCWIFGANSSNGTFVVGHNLFRRASNYGIRSQFMGQTTWASSTDVRVTVSADDFDSGRISLFSLAMS